MNNYSHLDALNLNLSNERTRLTNAKSSQEKELRTVWVNQLEKEIAAERKFLGIADSTIESISDEELFKELGL